jgi:hypothetical protein
MDNIFSSKRLNAKGLNRIPVSSIPRRLGSFSFWKIEPSNKPRRKI